MSTSPITIQQVLRNHQNRLSGDAAQLEAEILLAYVLQCSRTYLRTWPEKILSTEQTEQFERLIKCRSNGEPVAYLIGERDFWDMTLSVSPDTLIPRPETETLVEFALERIPLDARWHIADLGTGSGAIALAIARERPLCQLVATDISAAALLIAQKNAEQLSVKNIRFVKGPWFAPLADAQFEVVVSNPPYVHPADPHLKQGDLRFEPLSALQSGKDGLADIRCICAEARKYLRAPGWLLVEHGYDQGIEVSKIFQKEGSQQTQTEKDLAQNDRITIGVFTDKIPSRKP